MQRFLTAVFLAFFALGLAAPAHADKGDKWRDGRGGDQSRQRANDDGFRRDGKQRDGKPPWVYDGPGDDRQYQNRRGKADRPWFGRRREHDRARDGVIRGRMIPLEELENKITRRTPGYRIGNPEFLMFGGRPVYRIRWRTPNGRILIVFADAETGQIIDIRGRR